MLLFPFKVGKAVPFVRETICSLLRWNKKNKLKMRIGEARSVCFHLPNMKHEER